MMLIAPVFPLVRAPDPEIVARAALLLRSAANPIVLVGDGVAWSEAQAEL